MSNTEEHVPSYDSTMDYFYSLATQLGPCSNLPDSLKDIQKAAEFVNYIDNEIVPLSHTLNSDDLILKAGELTREKIPDVGDGKTRANIAFRMYAGGFDSAKTIRDTYVDKVNPDGTLDLRPYTPEIRKDDWNQKMKPRSEEDSLYKYGVELGTVIKKIRNQPVYLAGIPSDSIVRKYVRKGKEGDVISPEDILV